MLTQQLHSCHRIMTNALTAQNNFDPTERRFRLRHALVCTHASSLPMHMCLGSACGAPLAKLAFDKTCSNQLLCTYLISHGRQFSCMFAD